ncbi:hypothetical protein PCH_Pc19g00300 [Penicillium rubens Wisconsin 54-1255]|uniref:Uncharacterized protein n=1 Tax=Penicillium rubens (strain ATCC 28089 / DSM 1075 / NRRL 1951 / Wisconsin 54-1255) TaxID=500485 RepID=B6HD23_PENRW|nr:hypothetical protein PCH_Pc19g00300 [Penicillium rubens Wisconsin 54-1255]
MGQGTARSYTAGWCCTGCRALRWEIVDKVRANHHMTYEPLTAIPSTLEPPAIVSRMTVNVGQVKRLGAYRSSKSLRAPSHSVMVSQIQTRHAGFRFVLHFSCMLMFIPDKELDGPQEHRLCPQIRQRSTVPGASLAPRSRQHRSYKRERNLRDVAVSLVHTLEKVSSVNKLRVDQKNGWVQTRTRQANAIKCGRVEKLMSRSFSNRALPAQLGHLSVVLGTNIRVFKRIRRSKDLRNIFVMCFIFRIVVIGDCRALSLCFDILLAGKMFVVVDVSVDVCGDVSVDVSVDVSGDERGGEWSGGEGDGQRLNYPTLRLLTYSAGSETRPRWWAYDARSIASSALVPTAFTLLGVLNLWHRDTFIHHGSAMFIAIDMVIAQTDCPVSSAYFGVSMNRYRGMLMFCLASWQMSCTSADSQAVSTSPPARGRRRKVSSFLAYELTHWSSQLQTDKTSAVKGVVAYPVGHVVRRFDYYTRIFLSKPRHYLQRPFTLGATAAAGKPDSLHPLPRLFFEIKSYSSSSPRCGGHVGMSLFEQAATAHMMVAFGRIAGVYYDYERTSTPARISPHENSFQMALLDPNRVPTVVS